MPPSHGPREDWMRNPRKVLAKGSAHKSSALLKLKLGARASIWLLFCILRQMYSENYITCFIPCQNNEQKYSEMPFFRQGEDSIGSRSWFPTKCVSGTGSWDRQ